MTLDEAISDLIDVGVTPILVSALRHGRLTRSSTPIELETLLIGQHRAQATVAALVRCWNLEMPSADGRTLARFLECIAYVQQKERQRAGSARLVWTGPTVPGVYPRTSRQIIRELISSAQREIWLTAYWLAGAADAEGIVTDVIELLAQATDNGLDVAIALDGRLRSDGRTNFTVLASLWPLRSRTVPRLYTWADALGEPHLKLHAKTLVIDRREALISSANLTMHALERSMEMGVRLSGPLAAEVATQFEGLVSSGIFVEVPLRELVPVTP
jgi:cardiolipin synthase A/B